MKQDEIISMAVEASSMARLPWNGQWIFRSKKELMAFAALLAEKAAAKEREACLSECNELLKLSARQATHGDHFEIGRESGHTECIEAIRARGTKEGA